MSEYATKDELKSALKEQTDEIVGVIQAFVQQMDDRFTGIEKEQQKTRDEVSRLFDYLDSMLKKQEISDDERIVMGHQLDRLDKWTHELADKIGHKLAT